ncbi:MAG: hypothetical protein LAP39_28210 [Acidobacteriia bacterium]|nr:hypothetical protein [Terriglobia bacterium]
MPALLILAVISWLFGSEKGRPKADAFPIFTALAAKPRRSWRPLFYSIVAHAVVITLLFLSPDLFSSADDDFVVRQTARQPLVIRLPNRMDLVRTNEPPAPPADQEKNTTRVAIRRKDLRKSTEEAKALEPPALPAPKPEASPFSNIAKLPELAKVEPKKFELPDIPVKNTATQTILQAEMPPAIPAQIDKKLPQLVFWDAQAKRPDRPIVPGNRKLRLETPRLASTPLLEAPNLALATSDLRMAPSPVPLHAALPVPPGTTMPLRMLDPADSPSGPSSIDPLTGEPVQLLALSPNPAPLSDALKGLFIPPGNQLARLPGASALLGFRGPGGSGSSANGGGGADGAGNGGKSGAGGSGDGLFGILNPPGLKGTPLRIIHPNNGVFDIVVVQNSSSETFPDAAAALSGRPIYTVYLQVGSSKEWVLQFCVPETAGPIQTGGLVKLGKPAPIGAPYPMVTVRPPEDWQHGSEYLLVHGFLDESGRFRDLRILPSHEPTLPTTSALLDYLAFWEFRPAVRDGRPVKVEVILAVPPDQLSQT